MSVCLFVNLSVQSIGAQARRDRKTGPTGIDAGQRIFVDKGGWAPGEGGWSARSVRDDGKPIQFLKSCSIGEALRNTNL